MKFIVLEGLDGSGKTTQIKRLKRWFDGLGLPCFATRQPSDGAIGTLAREATSGKYNLDNETFALLFAAEHFQHYKDAIEPALNAGQYVICDRYYYSNFAYQGTDAATMERIMHYNYAVMNPPVRRPDIVIFLDVQPQESMKRINSTRQEISIFETEEKLVHQRERYRAAFEMLGENVVTIDTTALDKYAVFERIISVIEPYSEFS